MMGPDHSAAPHPNRGLVAGLRRAHAELRDCGASPLSDVTTLTNAEAPKTQRARQLSLLAFLAPDLQLMILEGRQPPRLTLRNLLKSDLPLDWDAQRAWIKRLGSSAIRD